MSALKCQYHGLLLPLFFHLSSCLLFPLSFLVPTSTEDTHSVPALYGAVEQRAIEARPCPREEEGMEAVTGKYINDCAARIRLDSPIG